MKSVVFFYDYFCPYCKKGYAYLEEAMKDHDDVEIEWRPIEVHPRPEESFPHTDLCIEAYYSAEAAGAATPEFHEALFKAACDEKQNVEDIDTLVGILGDIVPSDVLKADLESGKYKDKPHENNVLAYEQSGVWAVPAFRSGDEKLDAIAGIGVTKKQVAKFLNK